MRTATHRLAILTALFLLVGCDHVSKHAAKTALDGHADRPVIHGLVDLHYLENTDVAFNLLRWVPESIRKPALVVTGTAAVLALIAGLLRARRASLRSATTLGVLLVTAGAMGNVLDRLTRGYVVDFIRVPHWPVFNVADAYVTAGALLMIVALGRARPATAEDTTPPPRAS